MSRTLYLLRHGQTRYNAELRLQGRCNSEADPRGEAQALAMGNRLNELLAEPASWTLYASPSAGQGRRRNWCVSSLDWERVHHLGRTAGGVRGWGSGESRRVPELLAAHPELDLEEPDWYLRPRMARVLRAFSAGPGNGLRTNTLPSRPSWFPHGLFGAMLRGAYADLDYATTWLQELPQDAFFKLSGGRIERIAC